MNTITPKKTLTLHRGAVIRPRVVEPAAPTVPTEPGEREFWFAWRRGARGPRFRHATREAAVTEAQRIAERHPGAVILVYAAYLTDKKFVSKEDHE